MMTNEAATARVAKGAAFLDQSHPDWFNAIDVGVLDIANGCFCVLGQVCGGYWQALKAQGWQEYATLALVFSPEAAALGFSLEPADLSAQENAVSDGLYRPLQDAWIVAICDRRMHSTDRKLRAEPAIEQPVLVAVRA